MQNNNGSLTRELTFSALLVAASYVLSMIRMIQLPNGGSVTLFSMLPVCLIAYMFGPRAGLISGVSLGIVNLITNPYVIHPAQLVLDYILAFGALGIGGFLRDTKPGLSAVYLTGVFGRFVCSTLSGFIFFASYAEGSGMIPIVYSIAYNGSYMGLEALITLVVINLPPIRKFFAASRERYGTGAA